jgi:hypothetical protein
MQHTIAYRHPVTGAGGTALLSGSEQASAEKARLERLGFVVMFVMRPAVTLAGSRDESSREAEH